MSSIFISILKRCRKLLIGNLLIDNSNKKSYQRIFKRFGATDCWSENPDCYPKLSLGINISDFWEFPNANKYFPKCIFSEFIQLDWRNCWILNWISYRIQAWWRNEVWSIILKTLNEINFVIFLIFYCHYLHHIWLSWRSDDGDNFILMTKWWWHYPFVVVEITGLSLHVKYTRNVDAMFVLT